jgi:hypothetical protein
MMNDMRAEILNNSKDPRELEKLYRSDKSHFKQEFVKLYPELKGHLLADFWNERLNHENDDVNWGSRKELSLIIVGSLIAGLIAKLPAIFSLNAEFFYPRNIGFIIFPLLTAYFAWRHKLPPAKIYLVMFANFAGLLFINLFPDFRKSDTLTLSCIHLLLFLWSVLGFAFVEGLNNQMDNRLKFLKYNGDLVVMVALMLIAGGIMTGITIGLFSLIGFHIEEFYFQNIAVFGLAAAPLIGTYLTQTNPQLVGKVSPVIAKLFSPLVLIMLVAYLSAMVYSGKNPYNDREFLLIFNALLIGVMALIFFSVSEASGKGKAQIWVLFFLSAITIIVNSVALSAILFRISAWGFTPNRTAVLGGNTLILLNLVMVTTNLFKALFKRTEIGEVGKAIAVYLPVYVIWTFIVTFLFPFIFGFK